jgi:hypothetical protein
MRWVAIIINTYWLYTTADLISLYFAQDPSAWPRTTLILFTFAPIITLIAIIVSSPKQPLLIVRLIAIITNIVANVALWNLEFVFAHNIDAAFTFMFYLGFAIINSITLLQPGWVLTCPSCREPGFLGDFRSGPSSLVPVACIIFGIFFFPILFILADRKPAVCKKCGYLQKEQIIF